jgi:hypothetical protein
MSELALRGGPDDEIASLEAEIAARRERVATSLGDLHQGINDVLSWRYWVRSHPIAWICAGVCLGFVVGGGGRRDRNAE